MSLLLVKILVNLQSVKGYASFCRLIKMNHSSSECRFTAAGLSNYSNCFSLWNIEADAVNRLDSSDICKEISMNVIKLYYILRILHLCNILGLRNILSVSLFLYLIGDSSILFGDPFGFLS